MTRLAIIYDCLYPVTTGGGERQYRGFAERALEAGHDVTYVTARQWGSGAKPSTPFPIVTITPKMSLYDGAGVRRTGAALRFAWALFRYLLRHRRSYDAVIVSALPVLNVLAARAALIGTGVDLVGDYLEVWGRRQWIEYAGAVTGSVAWALQYAAIRATPLATCHSRLSADRLLAEGLRGRLLVSPGLIDAARDIPPRPSAAAPPTVLYAGRHIPDKRVELLPAAVAVARKHIPDLRLTILGSGPTSHDVDAAVVSAGSPPWISREGFVSQDRLDELMGSAACVVNPSKREGYGLIVVESCAHGTPVALIEDPGNAATELVEQGTNGFVAPSAGADDLAAAIVACVQGGDELRTRSRAWYDGAIRTRTIDATMKQILQALTPGDKQTQQPSPAEGTPA